jgi:hypothetical protein
MRRVRLGSRLRLGAAAAAVLVAAGGIVAAVTQEEHRSSGLSTVDEQASLEGLEAGGGGVVADSGAPMVVGQARALSGSVGSTGPATTAARPNADTAFPQTSPGDPNGPRIVKRADVRIEVKADGFRAAFDRASSVASAHGGFVANSTSQTDNGEKERSASGTLVLRVPADSFDTVRAELAGLGKVTGLGG